MRSTWLGLMVAVAFVVKWTADVQVPCPTEAKTLTRCVERRTVGEAFDKKDSADVFERVLKVMGAQDVKLEEIKKKK